MSGATATKKLEQIVGKEAFIAPGSDPLAERGDPMAFRDDGNPPLAVVSPGSVEEVQAVVRVAGEEGLKLWTISRGRNLAYGGSSARERDSVLVDLSRMKRILDVDEESGVAIIEPGVSFFDLYEHLRATDSSLMTSVPDLGWGSIMGNSLERGFGYTAHGEHAAMMCGLEIVLADGSIVRTGMGAQAGGSTWGHYKGGYGPGLDGLFVQSNFGIVTKMGHWLMPKPESFAVCVVKVADEDSLAPLADALRPLTLDGTIQSVVIIGNALVVACNVASRSKFYDGPGLLPAEIAQGIRDGFGIGYWNARFGLYGPKALVDARLAVVEKAVAAVTGAELVVTRYEDGFDPEKVFPPDRAQLGVPSTDSIQMAAWRGGDPAHTDIALLSRPTGDQMLAVAKLVRSEVEKDGLDHVGGFAMFGRHAIGLTLLSFDRSDPGDRALIDGLVPRMLSTAAEAGFLPYRSHVTSADQVAASYDFNDGALLALNKRLKTALDPEGILSPGKYGI